MNITPDSDGSLIAADDIWCLAGLSSKSLSRLILTGNVPLLPSSFHVGVAAQSSIACAALAASEIGQIRTGDFLESQR
jgi:hypothetical protein